eukprot:Em0018g1209a
MLCFSRRRKDGHRPFLVYDKGVETRLRKAMSSKDRKRLRSQNDDAKEATSVYDKAPRDLKSTAHPFVLINPMGSTDQLDSPWDNPVFDREQSKMRVVAIVIQSWWRMARQRKSFLELRHATILCQSLCRARRVRKMLPQWEAEKQIRDQQKRKMPGWKKKGTLSALKFFDVKGFGFAEVEQLYGIDTVREAAEKLKNLYGSKGKMKLKLFISVKGIKLFDATTLELFATVNISSVSFCTLDPKNPKIFAFINRKKKKIFCHVFQCHEGHHHRSQELDAEVASMMEMAERASMHTPMMERASIDSYSVKDDVQSTNTPLAIRASLPNPLNSSRPMLHIAETHGLRANGFSSHYDSGTSLNGSRGNLRKSQPNMTNSNLLISTVAPSTSQSGVDNQISPKSVDIELA